MKILAHRGFWKKKTEQNTILSFRRALDHGYGIELDVRDHRGEVIVSHDLPTGAKKSFEFCLKQLSRSGNFRKNPIAINIKSDGLEDKIEDLLNKYGIMEKSFVFDMSVPSMFIFHKFHRKIKLATRHSDIEENPVLYDFSRWVWLDELRIRWISNSTIIRHLKNNKSVCVVSPELHKRSYLAAWKEYSLLPKQFADRVYICTDFPLMADKFFNWSK